MTVTTAWTKLNLQPDPQHGVPMERSSHGLSLLQNGSRLFLYGGEHVARTPITGSSSACWLADLQTQEPGSWKALVSSYDPRPPDRIAHAQAVHQDRTVYIFGGRAGVAMNEQAMNDLWAFDIETETWTQVTPANAPPEARSFHRMVCIQDSLYVFGGCGAAHGRLADLHRFDIANQTWHNLGASQLRGRGGPNLIPIDEGRKLLVVAGFAGEETADGQIYDTVAGQWAPQLLSPSSELQGLRPRSVCISAAFSSLGLALIFGGEVNPSDRGHSGAGGFENDIVLLDEKNGSMKERVAGSASIATSGSNDGKHTWPVQRGWSDGAALDAGDGTCGRLYVFGGLTGDDKNPERLNDLWRLDITPSP